MRLKRLRIVMLLLPMTILLGGQVYVQSSDIITVMGLYVDFSGGKYKETLSSCDTHEMWRNTLKRDIPPLFQWG